MSTPSAAAGLGTSPLVQAYRQADRSVPLVDHTVGALLAGRASAHPDREALVGVRHGSGAADRLTYAELYDESRRVAAGLRKLAAPGERVALWAPNVIEWTVIQYGAALAGVVLVALNPVLRGDDLDYALRHSGARVLLHADVSRDYAMAEVAVTVCAGLSGIRCISLSQRDEWMAWPGPDRGETEAPGPDSPVMLQYTSGTTGRPKGVLLTHRALINVARLTMEATGVADGAVCFNPLPLFHTAGCVIATLGPLWVAGTLVLWERFDAGEVLAALRREDVSVLFYVPTVLHALLQRQRESGEPAPRLRVIMGGASTVSSELIDGAAAVFGAGVYNLYGQTELAPVLSLTRPGDTRRDQLGTVGRPLPQVDCKVIDPETGHVVAVGETGEICARGYQQFVEYLHDPEATARALDREGYVRTGDLGSMDERGYLRVTGRLKELIIRGGENISPVEVESVIARHARILDAVAVGLPDDRLGEIVTVACRVADGPHEGLRESLVEHARLHMPSYKVPDRWFLVDEFPTTPTGKVQRFALREALLARELREL
ncbi:class I adenylate-forming enzyme family protein [Mycolicibacterium palauense]|uniref:class I adenylate-forming enzyme family protein n=1 Tax=Mycolicibacterium palauense TaxID=2034511 RepID=UPI000BFF05BA|nr:class I adenylate-forming enzyme family protein [Mycolicibacterium palauense]